MDTEHTPLPWTQIDGDVFDADGSLIAITLANSGSDADAAFIVHSVNLLPELVEALREAREWVECGPDLPGVSVTDEYAARDCLATIDALLTRAEIEAILAGTKGVTPGPWFNDRKHRVGPRIDSNDQSDGMMASIADTDGPENAAHIARLDPQTVSALCTALLESMDRVEELENEKDDLSERIENAKISSSETQPSWKHRCYKIMGALGIDYGDPDWTAPDEVNKALGG